MGTKKKGNGNGNGHDGDLEQPIRQLLREIERHPGDPARLTQLGRLYIEALRWSDAVDAFREAQRHGPSKADAHSIHLGLGRAFHFLGRRDDVLSNLREAVRLMPEEPNAQLMLGVECTEAGRYDEAKEALEAAAKLKPDDPQVHAAFAMLCYGLKRYVEGAAALRRAIALDPKDGNTHFLLGLHLTQLGRYQAAAKALQDATELAPYNADAWYYLALTCLELKDSEGAAAARRRLAPLDPVRAEEVAAAERREQMTASMLAAGGVVLVNEPQREPVEEDISQTPKKDGGRWLKDVKSDVRYVDKSAPPEKQLVRWIGYCPERMWGPRYLLCTEIPPDTFINLYRPLLPDAGWRVRLGRWRLWLRWTLKLFSDSLPGGAELIERARLRRALRPPRGVDPDATVMLRPLKDGRHVPADVRPLYDTLGFWCVRVER
jgi:cytochrome c-type biogenesis protein CcmH/NrfG